MLFWFCFQDHSNGECIMNKYFATILDKKLWLNWHFIIILFTNKTISGLHIQQIGNWNNACEENNVLNANAKCHRDRNWALHCKLVAMPRPEQVIPNGKSWQTILFYARGERLHKSASFQLPLCAARPVQPSRPSLGTLIVNGTATANRPPMAWH